MNRQPIVERVIKPSSLKPASIFQRKAVKKDDSLSSIIKPQTIYPESNFNHDFSKVPIKSALPHPIQAKLTIGASNDKYEQEADRVAEQVISMPDHQLGSSKDRSPPHQITPLIQTKTTTESSPTLTPETNSAIRSLQGAGQPLSKADRSYFESRFRTDFSNVRIHNNQKAAGLAGSVNARAFTYGNNVVFGSGEYSSSTLVGKKLLAHELTHVVQQSKFSKTIQRSGFSSTMNICHNYLRSRDFKVSTGGVRIKTNASISDPDNRNCRHHQFSIELRKKGTILDDPYGTCNFSTSKQPVSKDWGGLPKGDYFLDINRLYDNPYCCLNGKIEVSDESGLTKGSCTKLPSGPLEILHSALQVAGLIPALGVIPDALDTGIFVIEGDWVNAGVSAAAMVPVFGQGAAVTRLGVKVSKESIERLGREGVEKALREGVARSATRVLRKAPPERVVAAVQKFRSTYFKAGSETFLLDSKGLRHILERHHPRYWNGSVKSSQSFLSEHLSVGDVADAIKSIMSQNRQKLIKIGTTKQGQINGTWGGVKYVIGLNRGRVGQFYPL